jgi:hypothetical protein
VEGTRPKKTNENTSRTATTTTQQTSFTSQGSGSDIRDDRPRSVRKERSNNAAMSSGRYSSKDLKEEKLVINSNIKLEPLKKRDNEDEEEPIPLLPPPPGTKSPSATATTQQSLDPTLSINSPSVSRYISYTIQYSFQFLTSKKRKKSNYSKEFDIDVI